MSIVEKQDYSPPKTDVFAVVAFSIFGAVLVYIGQNLIGLLIGLVKDGSAELTLVQTVTTLVLSIIAIVMVWAATRPGRFDKSKRE
ncbi:MAG: hypothetical protein AAF903_02740 [Pseudomonadota bacterium]